MAVDKDATFTLKAVINKQKNKVLLAEIDDDLANVLLGFMTLPLGRIVQLLMNHYGENAPAIGSLNTLYNSVANLDSCYFESCDKKQRLLDPESAFVIRNTNLYGSVPTEFINVGEAFTGKFIAYSASFILTDDLRMTIVCQTFIECLDYAEVAMEDLDEAEIRIVTFGVDEIMDLLKGSLISLHPLTDVILGTKWMNPTPEISKSAGISLFDLIEEEEQASAPKSMYKMFFTLTFEKSSKKFLFAQTEQDFVDLLFSMLIIPLGVVENLCNSSSGLNNIDNLYESITAISKDLFCDTHDWLFGNINHLEQESLFTSTDDVVPEQFFVDLRAKSYIVTDDLSVTPFSVCSTMSLLNQMKVSPSDVEELGVVLGYEEVTDLNILKASLTSTSALTDGLVDIILKRRKKEKKKTLTNAPRKTELIITMT